MWYLLPLFSSLFLSGLIWEKNEDMGDLSAMLMVVLSFIPILNIGTVFAYSWFIIKTR